MKLETAIKRVEVGLKHYVIKVNEDEPAKSWYYEALRTILAAAKEPRVYALGEGHRRTLQAIIDYASPGWTETRWARVEALEAALALEAPKPVYALGPEERQALREALQAEKIWDGAGECERPGLTKALTAALALQKPEEGPGFTREDILTYRSAMTDAASRFTNWGDDRPLWDESAAKLDAYLESLPALSIGSK